MDKTPTPRRESERDGPDRSSTLLIPTRPLVEEVRPRPLAVLRICSNGSVQDTVRIKRPETIIGRAKGCHVRLELGSVSRYHARLLLQAHEYVIEDLGSTNGTFVNGVRVLKCVLRHSDQIQLGEAKIYFFEERECQSKSPQETKV